MRNALSRHSGLRSVSAIALSLPFLVAAPAGAQSPSEPVSSDAPAATPAGPLVDPDTAAGQLLALRDTLQADRLLLAALRKDVPETRDAGEAFVSHVVGLALASDPAGLGVIVSRVRDAAPAWLDWRAEQYPTAQEAADAYVQLGAAAFDASWESLHDAVLFTVVNRLDTIIDLADRIEDGR